MLTEQTLLVDATTPQLVHERLDTPDRLDDGLELLRRVRLIASKVGHLEVAEGGVQEVLRHLLFGVQILRPATARHAVQRRLRDVEMPRLDELRHLAEEEREQQRADMRPVHVGVRHQDDLVVSQLLYVEVAEADPRAESGNDRDDVPVLENLVQPRLRDVDALAPERQHRLVATVTPLFRRPAGGIALDEEQLRAGRVALRAVRQLAGQRAGVEHALTSRHLARLTGRFAGRGRLDALLDDVLRKRRVLFEELRQPFVHDGLNDPVHLGVPERVLRLALELRVRHPRADDADHPLADVLARQFDIRVLRQPTALGVGVERARKRGLEPADVRPTVLGVHAVDVGIDDLVVAIVELKGDFDDHIVPLSGEVYRLRVQKILALVKVAHELDDAVLVIELAVIAALAVGVRALVSQRDPHAAVQERQLTQTRRKRVEAEVHLREDRHVGMERMASAGLLRLPGDFNLARRHATFVLLLVHEAVQTDFRVHPVRERVHAGETDAVQAARDLVARAFTPVELTAGVQHRHGHFKGGLARCVFPDGNAAPVVGDGDATVGVQDHFDEFAEAGRCLVDAVVHELGDELMQT